MSVALEGSADDAWIKVELNARGSRRLRFVCQPFARGSARSGALSRASAIRKAREALPRDASPAKVKLVVNKTSRLWVLVWATKQHQTFRLALNARTGWVVTWQRSGHTPLEAAPAPAPALEGRAREVALETLRLAACLKLGAACRLGPPILGVRQSGESTAPVWLTVVEDPQGKVYWASLGSGPVRFKQVKSARQRA